MPAYVQEFFVLDSHPMRVLQGQSEAFPSVLAELTAHGQSSIWGLSTLGKTCKACGISVHTKCELKVSLHAAQRTHNVNPG